MKRWVTAVAAWLVFASANAAAQDQPVRLRGTVQSFSEPVLVIKERSGETLSLTLPEETGIAEVIPTDITSVQPGSFIGTATLPRADGTLEALEVVVFPEIARGVGEGHFAWDLKPGSHMTNATVAELSRSSGGRKLLLRYPAGEQTVIVPDGVPVVTMAPGNRTLIIPGARVFIVADPVDSQFIVRRLLVGRAGTQPPM